ncbi:Sensor histidine kinase RcsC [Bremerella volcania]|uniref:Sensor histidine kinase RcsC n=1 Tax=Bremerella volcania TaxID=2527984 RepID=A0A518C6N0_9BACT|nr:HDOD domain-containing protein [Bremerella volcania]QDU74864.1 Sensor histidine kinase RcsC [Bremerella volcania]
MVTEHLTALVVDDELPVRALLAKALGEVGFQCVESSDGQDAWQQHEKSPFDLVVTDLKMPKMNGHKLCVDLLNSPTRPIVSVLTGIRHERLIQDLESRGIDLIRHKPINFRNLARELRGLLDQKVTSVQNASEPLTESEDPSDESLTPKAEQHRKHAIGVLLKDKNVANELAGTLTDSSKSLFVTTNSEQLCQVLDHHRIDLLLIENDLGGFLSGIEIVERLNHQLIRPKVVLFAEESSKIHQIADENGVEFVTPINTDRNEIKTSVQRILRDTLEHDAFIPPLARHLVKDFGDIPPLPQLVVKLAGYLAMPLNDISIDELADDISADTRAATDLLKVTNRGRSHFEQTTSVHQAVNLHGPKRTIAMVMSMATMKAQSDVLNKWDETHRQWYQKRSVIIAAAASVFAERLENCSPDTAYILGLVQDIGCLVLANKFGSRYDLIAERVQGVGRTQLHQLELESFQIHHAHVSAALLQKWRLPQALVRTVVAHHDPDAEEGLPKVDASYLRVIQLAEAFANAMDMPHPYRSFVLSQCLEKFTDHSHDQRVMACTEALEKAQSLCELFEFPVPDQAELGSILQKSTASLT